MTDNRMPPPSDSEHKPARRRRVQAQVPDHTPSIHPVSATAAPHPQPDPTPASTPPRRRRPPAAQTKPASAPQPAPKIDVPPAPKPVSAPQRAWRIAEPDPVRPAPQFTPKSSASASSYNAPVSRRSAKTTYIANAPQFKVSPSASSKTSAPVAPVVRRKRAKPKKRRRIRIKADRLIIIALACVCVFCFVSAVRILMRTFHTKSVNNQLSALHEASMQTLTPTDEPETALVFAAETPEMFMPESETQSTANTEPDISFTEVTEPNAQPLPTPSPTPAPENNGKFHQLYGDALPEMAALYAQNKDLVGWLNIPEVLDLPVMFRDNSYYLTHDFYGKTSASGTLFLDETHPFKEKTQNLLLHGHNMKDGTMFGRLEQYAASLDYLKAHSFIRFDSLWQHEYYVIFAVLHVVLDVNDPHFFDYYAHPTFSSDITFDTFVRKAQLASQYAIPVNVRPTDALLTLSTCEGEDRLVILARRVRADETQNALRQVVRLTVPQ